MKEAHIFYHKTKKKFTLSLLEGGKTKLNSFDFGNSKEYILLLF